MKVLLYIVITHSLILIWSTSIFAVVLICFVFVILVNYLAGYFFLTFITADFVLFLPV